MDPAETPIESSRREFLQTLGAGFTALATTGMLSADGAFAYRGARPDDDDPLAAKRARLPAKAKSCIFLFMYGGP
ncbi:MAG: DUF1501 domain-containing protein, partial [Planctomycetes bacterium]|nr:DUF1501 domain-containing protein [Planctomycetota bacterium]